GCAAGNQVRTHKISLTPLLFSPLPSQGRRQDEGWLSWSVMQNPPHLNPLRFTKGRGSWEVPPRRVALQNAYSIRAAARLVLQTPRPKPCARLEDPACESRPLAAPLVQEWRP